MTTVVPLRVAALDASPLRVTPFRIFSRRVHKPIDALIQPRNSVRVTPFRIFSRRVHKPIGALIQPRNSFDQKKQQRGSGGDKTHHHTHLPPVLWAPAEEFPGPRRTDTNTAAMSVERFTRLAQSMALSMSRPEALAVIAASVGSICSIGCFEANMMLAPEYWAAEPLGAFKFVTRYSLEQVIVSCVWDTQQPYTVAAAVGIDPLVALRPPFDGPLSMARTPAEASALLRAGALEGFRSIIATTLLLSQIINAVSLGIRGADAFRERVKLGKEPMFNGVSQRVIRLCGRQSDVTEVSLVRYGPHIVPVYERPALVSTVVHAHSAGLRVPVRAWRDEFQPAPSSEVRRLSLCCC